VPATRVDAQAAGVSSVKVKDQVEVLATPSGGKDTAASITDSTLLKQSGTHFGFAPVGPKGSTAGFGPGGAQGAFAPGAFAPGAFAPGGGPASASAGTVQ
jgi:hypothetical protein